MKNENMKISVLIASVLLVSAVTTAHADLLSSAGIMVRNVAGSGPDTGFALSATKRKRGAFGVTTASDPDHVVFNAVGSSNCIEKLDETLDQGRRTIRYIVGGKLSLAEAIIPGKGNL